MSPDAATKEYGKDNVRVKKGALRNGDDMVEVFVEGYKVLPPMDKEKYQARDGLEGPFSTLSGKVVYYDPKEGKYYDPDTDMYMSYDEFRRYDDDYKGMKDERDEVKEAGGYYTQPVYDMIEKHGYEKVMHELLTKLHADTIQDFLQRAELDESVSEASETKYGIVRYPDTAISYIKNDGNGWEHIFDKSYGFEGPVDKADLKYAKKIAKEKIPSRMMESLEELTEEQFDEAHQIDWPDEDMEQHAYNAIRHGMHAYDAYDHVYSMSRERDWLSANKDDIIKMFAQYGLQTESVEEAVAGPDKCWPGFAPGAKTGVKTKAGTGKNKGKRVNNCEKE